MGCDIHPYAEVRKDGRWQRADVKLCDDRNYESFGLLANVRNGFGFAGCDTGNPIQPIAEARGLPSDTSIADTEGVDFEEPGYTYLGDHSHSYVTLAELLAVDWNATVTRRGYVDPQTYENFQKYGYEPRRWCGMTTAADHKQIEWKVPLYKACNTARDIMLQCLSLGKAEDVRIVFGFDS
jgi:hypothetical protein